MSPAGNVNSPSVDFARRGDSSDGMKSGRNFQKSVFFAINISCKNAIDTDSHSLLRRVDDLYFACTAIG